MNKNISAYLPHFGATVNYEIACLLILLIVFDNMTSPPLVEGIFDPTTCKMMPGTATQEATAKTYCDENCTLAKSPSVVGSLATCEPANSTTVPADIELCSNVTALTDNSECNQQMTAADTNVKACVYNIAVPVVPIGTTNGSGTCEKRCLQTWTEEIADTAANADFITASAGYAVTADKASLAKPAPSDIMSGITCKDGYEADGTPSFTCDGDGKFKSLTGCDTGFWMEYGVMIQMVIVGLFLGAIVYFWPRKSAAPARPVPVTARAVSAPVIAVK